MFTGRPRLLYVVTHPMTARYLLAGQLSWMAQRGFEVGVIASPGPDLEAVREVERVETLPVAMEREIAPHADFHSLVALKRRMSKWQPDIVNAGTPKAGLLGLMAARACGVGVRIYTLRGLRLETIKGSLERVLSVAERVSSHCAHQVHAVSESLALEYVHRGLAAPEKVKVLASGSSNGVRVEGRIPAMPEEVERLRLRLRLGPDDLVIGFVGRLTRDKGILDLFKAFRIVRVRRPRARLLLVGPAEPGDALSPALVAELERDPNIISTGFLEDPIPAYGLMNVMAFPSHREGFPNSPMEAAAAGLPVVGFRATGVVDAVIDGLTGTLVEFGDVTGFARAIGRYLDDPLLARNHGTMGRERVLSDFRPETVWGSLLEEYERLLAHREGG